MRIPASMSHGGAGRGADRRPLDGCLEDAAVHRRGVAAWSAAVLAAVDAHRLGHPSELVEGLVEDGVRARHPDVHPSRARVLVGALLGANTARDF
eukprot:6187175-Pleurochrysis_carterae.AAC.2